MEIGTALAEGTEERMDIRGRDLLTGLPKTIEISSQEISESLREAVASIIDGVRKH